MSRVAAKPGDLFSKFGMPGDHISLEEVAEYENVITKEFRRIEIL
uniref:Uncharacterized protein n=1 Tax=Oryza sativa subsp. japonica TaxID=39947 RepID=Q10Q57_ORYSJ|nr:hypothetical protein LOC_Os03g11069 [Oryza sativa Japonica Group]